MMSESWPTDKPEGFTWKPDADRETVDCFAMAAAEETADAGHPRRKTAQPC